jgi:hypothetical protein
VNLDPAWLDELVEGEDDMEADAKCFALIKSQQEFAIHHLYEGTNSLTQNNEKWFTVNATPYTPNFGEPAFQ